MRPRAGILLAVAVAVAVAVVTVPAAHASVWITNNATRPQLAVDARGSAQVTRTQGGVKQTVIIPPKGQLTHGGSLTGPDVSRPAPGLHVSLAVLVRRGPAGTFLHSSSGRRSREGRSSFTSRAGRVLSRSSSSPSTRAD